MSYFETPIARFYRHGSNRLIRSFYSIKATGFQKIPKRGSALVIANHVSYVDGMVLQACIDRPVRYLIDHYIYRLPVVHYFMKHNRAIPILPKKDSVEQALDALSLGLEGGDLVGLFPEGQLTYTGNLGRFKPGIEWIIERDPVPIYPVAIAGLWDSMFSRKYRNSKTRWFPKGIRGKVFLKCGEVIHPEHVRVGHLQRTILSLKESIKDDLDRL